MSKLTPELNLVQGEDPDDTADYLTIGLADSLGILDGLFNSSTGHAHNGAHQGGALQFLDLNVGEDLNVVGASSLHGSVHAYSNLVVDATSTLNSLDVTTTSHLRGLVTMDAGLTITGTISSTGAVSISQDLTVGRDLQVNRNATITGSLTVGSITTGGGGLNVGGNISAQVIYGTRGVFGGYDAGAGWILNVGGNGITSGRWYSRGNGGWYCYDVGDFTFGVPGAANTLVQRDGSGGIQVGGGGGIYWPSGAAGGKPTYVIGQGGDGYFHWYDTNAIGPPLSAWYAMANMTLPALSGGGGTANATLSATAATGGFTVQAQTITVPRNGYYSVAGGFNGSNNTGNSETMNVQVITSGHGAIDSLGVPIKISSFLGGYFSWIGFLNAGETIRVQFSTSFDAISGSGEIIVAFVPVAQYNN